MQTMNSTNSLELMRGGQAKAVTLLHFLLLSFMVWCSFVASFLSLQKPATQAIFQVNAFPFGLGKAPTTVLNADISAF